MPPFTGAARVQQAALALGRGERSAAPVSKAVALLRKVLANILKNPDEPKFRALKLGNKAVAAHLAPLPGAIAFLLVAGFEHDADGQLLRLPADADLAGLEAGLAALDSVPGRFVKWLPHGSAEARATALQLGVGADGGVLWAARGRLDGSMQVGAASAGGGGGGGGGGAPRAAAAPGAAAPFVVSEEAFAMGTPFGGGYRPPPPTAADHAPPPPGGRRNYIAERLDAELRAELGASAGQPVSDEAYAMGNPFGGGYRPTPAPTAAAPAAAAAAAAAAPAARPGPGGGCTVGYGGQVRLL